jgi:hypothetical protein
MEDCSNNNTAVTAALTLNSKQTIRLSEADIGFRIQGTVRVCMYRYWVPTHHRLVEAEVTLLRSSCVVCILQLPCITQTLIMSSHDTQVKRALHFASGVCFGHRMAVARLLQWRCCCFLLLCLHSLARLDIGRRQMQTALTLQQFQQKRTANRSATPDV